MNRLTLGILSLQGSVAEHRRCLDQLPDVKTLEVKTIQAMQEVNGLILPGGESTTIAKLLRQFNLLEPLKERIARGMPVWGTCAGMILLAKEIIGEPAHLGVIDITVRRNAYGRQIDSFDTETIIPEVSKEPVPLVFIRAPWIEQAGKEVEILSTVKGHIVAARQKNVLVTSFHPELTDNLAFHRYFANMCHQRSKTCL